MAKIKNDAYFTPEDCILNAVRIFKDIGKYEYYLFQDGIVYNLTSNKILNVCLENRSGLKYVNIRTKNSKRITYLHRLLAENFIPNPNKYNYVNFIDGNVSNYKLDNLKWEKSIKDVKFKYDSYNSYSKLYNVWKRMVSRCNSPKDSNFHKYGALGVYVCDEWLDYISFRDWSILNNYCDGLTIDRIDGSKGYEPSNCRWTNYTIQNINKKQKPSKSGYVGINYDKRDNVWKASISVNNKTVNIASHKNDIKYLVEIRNKHIIDNCLPHKLNVYIEQIPELE